jgi:hypothetical protein
VIKDIPEGKDENQESEENNCDKRDCPAGDDGHWVRLRIPYQASSIMMIKTIRDAVRYAKFS